MQRLRSVMGITSTDRLGHIAAIRLQTISRAQWPGLVRDAYHINGLTKSLYSEFGSRR